MSDHGESSSRAELAELWAARLNSTAYIPMSRDAVQDQLRELLDLVAEALADPARIDETGRTVGARLVALHATGPDSLAGSLDLLRDKVLNAAEDEQQRRSLSLVTAIAAGYAAADRANTFEQQERLKRALLRSKLQSDRDREVSESHFHEVFTSAPIGVAICERDGKLVEINPALAEMLGYQSRDVRELTIHDLFHPEDALFLAEAYAELADGEEPRRLREQRKLIGAEGAVVEVYLAVSVLRDGDGVPHQFVTMVENISELHRLQERFQHQALHDAMTGLPNRQFFRTRLEATLANLPKDATLVLYQLGLNGFELVNHGLGYETGDKLIRSVARRLEGLLSEYEAMLARFGGTEFGILVREVDKTPPVAAFVAMINEELSEPYYVDTYGIATTASIGVVRSTVADAEPSTMLSAADVALRRAEAWGARQWALFDRNRAPRERTRAKLAAMIPGALELGEFQVMYRPVSAMDSGRLATLEVQLCWEPEGYPVLSHAECLRLAELSGVTLSLRDWVFQSTWEQLSAWHEAGYRPRLAIGLGPHQAQDPDLVASVNGFLRDSELDPDWLWLSFPVKAVVGDREEARENVGLLHDRGVRTALHGFHGSPREFRLVRHLPVRAVRLAPELVRIIHGAEPDDERVEVQAVRRMVPLLDATDGWLVVGDVDTAEQAERWRALGRRCAGLGDYYGKPLPAADIPALLDGWPTED